jgi:hypothetical protein
MKVESKKSRAQVNAILKRIQELYERMTEHSRESPPADIFVPEKNE